MHRLSALFTTAPPKNEVQISARTYLVDGYAALRNLYLIRVDTNFPDALREGARNERNATTNWINEIRTRSRGMLGHSSRVDSPARRMNRATRDTLC